MTLVNVNCTNHTKLYIGGIMESIKRGTIPTISAHVDGVEIE